MQANKTLAAIEAIRADDTATGFDPKAIVAQIAAADPKAEKARIAKNKRMLAAKTKADNKRADEAAALSNKAPVAVNVHRGTVATSHYAGLSPYLNANRKTGVSTDNYTGRNVAAFTARTIGCFTAMRNAYGDKPFPVRGFDNAIIAMLAFSVQTKLAADGTPTTKTEAAPMLKLTGGMRVADANGTTRLIDAPGKPLTATITPFGASYGKATK